MKFDLVLFDVNETLADLAPVRAAFAAAGAPEWAASAWLAATLRDGIGLSAAGANAPFAALAEPAAREVFALAGVRGDPDAVVAAVRELPPAEGVREALLALREQDVRAATLSNGSAAVAQAVLERAGARGLVEACLSVESLSAWKPARSAYLEACASLDADPARTALVAVHPWDVDGARRAGLTGAWVDRGGRPYPQAFLPPSVTGGSLVEAVRALDGCGSQAGP